MRVAVAQFRSKLGELEENIRKTVEMAREAKGRGAKLCLFPELNLTGYNLQDLTFEVAVRLSDPRLTPLIELSREIALIVGLIEESSEHLFYNSALYIEGGAIKHVHRKVYLPTYGMFDEGRFTAAGNRVEVFSSLAGKSVTLICEDLWHMSTVYLAFIQGASTIFALSASPGRGYREKEMFGNAEVWLNMGEFYSRMTGSYFIYANRVGCEDGFTFSGCSFICNPFGEVEAQASPFQEELIYGEVKDEAVRAARISLPLLRDEKPLLTLENLRRALNERENF
ncbi:Nitrilase/cyanide hydratase and apolipoprotein N-acyltransferase [Thermovibrio ammonificans HB-1]|uniref:Nitrilase/cyanide hydratase and apolipoprotein N-acyltransferase n=1 Tax=Thermovibrio ammonificans (strain DSM 15698 / JCM 12110 / HB-1) TaxID=648996 RepID=E8T6E1_THEA1|nr:nitrilase-related carbon-nitrogen hydrolase [Thermovibrio ammonificans]ADU96725.1 Nitrilase/cyanide hydratase and apolipoprotein N-acyltransferase [Thermovibrio ammonificans HB-1]